MLYMNIAKIFLRTFDPVLMSGFKNQKQLKDYWVKSQIGCFLLALGIVLIIFNKVLLEKNLDLNFLIYTLFISSTAFGFVFILPFFINWIFIKIVPDNLTYMYVKYMWHNSKNAILIVLEELPENIITKNDMKKMLIENNDDKNIELLIKIWHKAFKIDIDEKIKKDS